jgi:carbon storage regulator
MPSAKSFMEGPGMLVLARKYHEQIVIGPPGPDQIVVTVVRIKGGEVRIGVDAGRHVRIKRAELPDAPGDSKLPG